MSDLEKLKRSACCCYVCYDQDGNIINSTNVPKRERRSDYEPNSGTDYETRNGIGNGLSPVDPKLSLSAPKTQPVLSFPKVFPQAQVRSSQEILPQVFPQVFPQVPPQVFPRAQVRSSPILPQVVQVSSSGEVRSSPSLPLPVAVEPPTSVDTAVDLMLSKPGIISRSEHLVLPSFTESGELRSSGYGVIDEDEVGFEAPPTPPPPPLPLVPQYSPMSTEPNIGAGAMEYMTDLVTSLNMRHDPDGVTWLTPANWATGEWNGTQTWNPCVLTKSQFMAGVFPSSPNVMRGLRQLFYQINPFVDVNNPTIAEIDAWHIEVIRLFRRLCGKSEATHPISNSPELYYLALWATERYKTSKWDSAYPGTWNSSYGPCVPSPTNAHCGAGFIPNCSDQIASHIYPGQRCIGDESFAEGVFTTNANIPWCIKFSRVLSAIIGAEYKTGHAGPFHKRDKIGLCWAGTAPTVTVRVKWGMNEGSLCP